LIQALVPGLAAGVKQRLVGGRYESINVLKMASLLAGIDSARYYEEHMLLARAFPKPRGLLRHGVTLASEGERAGGLHLEFGVATGTTLRHIAEKADSTVYGFDSFDGLPEEWRTGFEEGKFARPAPTDLPDNAELVVGLFADTLPEFAAEHSGDVAFLHVDCDLYSSTVTIFEHLGDRIGPGTVIVFDEFFNYPGWRQHEFLAFSEFIEASGLGFEHIGFVPEHQQVGVIITD